MLYCKNTLHDFKENLTFISLLTINQFLYWLFYLVEIPIVHFEVLYHKARLANTTRYLVTMTLFYNNLQ